MTIFQLKKIIDQHIKNGHGRKLVYVDKGTFRDPRESDGCVILPALGATMQVYGLCDDDGGMKIKKDGSESIRQSLVIYGYSKEIGKKAKQRK
jgi:hypothetical protein